MIRANSVTLSWYWKYSRKASVSVLYCGVVEDLVGHVGKAIEKALQKKKLRLVCE